MPFLQSLRPVPTPCRAESLKVRPEVPADVWNGPPARTCSHTVPRLVAKSALPSV